MNVIYHYKINFCFSEDVPNLNIQSQYKYTAGLSEIPEESTFLLFPVTFIC